MSTNTDRSDGFRWSDIHASDNARQHVGPAYHYETHNYAGPTSHMNVPVKPWKDPVHGDLIRACRQGQGPRRLNFLFARGADIDYRDEQQRTPLHHAASSGFLSTLSHLVDSGGDVHACAPRFGTPLHCAALSGSARAVKFLVDAGAKVNTLDKIVGTPLHCAAFCGSADTVRCLLESGAEMNTVSDWVGTPLSIATAKVHMTVLEVLLEYGVNVNEPCGYFGSAAHMACAVGSIQLLQRLQRAGAGFDRSVDTCRVIYGDILESVGPSFAESLGIRPLEVAHVVSGSPVILAIIHGNLEAAKFCMDMDTEGDTYSSYVESWRTDSVWRTPSTHMYSSVTPAVAAHDLDMLQLLLDRGVFPDQEMVRRWMHSLGSNIWITASDKRKASACISLLIRHGVQTNSLDTGRDTGGETLLMAIMGAHVTGVAKYEAAKVVLQHGVHLNAVNPRGQTALMIAAMVDEGQCVQLLCEHGADVDLKDKDGMTALRYAEKWGGSDGYEDVKRILQTFRS